MEPGEVRALVGPHQEVVEGVVAEERRHAEHIRARLAERAAPDRDLVPRQTARDDLGDLLLVGRRAREQRLVLRRQRACGGVRGARGETGDDKDAQNDPRAHRSVIGKTSRDP
jgi:hypothetical protein